MEDDELIESNDDESRDRGSGDDMDAEIRAAIDEAVHAVEEVEARRREEASRDSTPAAVQSDDVEVLQNEVNSLRDRLLRTLADFDNFRKRVERERTEQQKYAASEVLREVLGIVDNLDRAMEAEGDLDDFKQGVEMIGRQTRDFLRRSGVERIEAEGEVFDPAFHEAVSRIEDPEVSDPTVLEEFQPGYVVHGRLLRPAIVRVAVPVTGSAQESGEDAAGEGVEDTDEDTGETAS